MSCSFGTSISDAEEHDGDTWYSLRDLFGRSLISRDDALRGASLRATAAFEADKASDDDGLPACKHCAKSGRTGQCDPCRGAHKRKDKCGKSKQHPGQRRDLRCRFAVCRQRGMLFLCQRGRG